MLSCTYVCVPFHKLMGGSVCVGGELVAQLLMKPYFAAYICAQFGWPLQLPLYEEWPNAKVRAVQAA